MSPFSRRFSLGRRPAPVRGRSGFTIVELLVATAITLVVLGLMVQVTFSTLQTFERVTGTLNGKAEAQRVFDYLRRDFASLIWKRDGNVWLLATVQDDQSGVGDSGVADADWSPTGNPRPGNANPSSAGSSLRLQKKDPAAVVADRWQDLSDYRFGHAGVWLRFFTNQTTSSTNSPAPVAVGYQIIRMKPQANSTVREMRYLFFRSVVRPRPEYNSAGVLVTRSVEEAGFDLTDNVVDHYNRPSNSNSGNLEPGGIRRPIGNNPPTNPPDRTLLLANNVIDFGVRFWRRNKVTGQDVLLFPADNLGRPANTALGYAATMDPPATVTATNQSPDLIPFGSNLTVNGFNTAGEQDVGFPDYAEVMIRVLTDEGARLIAAYENGDSEAPAQSGSAPTQAEKDAYWWALAEQHSVVYTDTIPLPARPL